MDKYKNIKELQANEKKKNYSIKSEEVNKDYGLLIFTPHGGGIEPGTSEIVKEISANNFHYYCFEGHGRGCKRMHITSHRFDERKLLNLLKMHDSSVSIHGMEDRKDCEIYIGGLNTLMIKKTTTILRQAGYNVLSNQERPINGLAAIEVNNVTNRCKSKKGMQIELSDSLRKRLFIGNYKIKVGRKNKRKEFYMLCDAVKKVLN